MATRSDFYILHHDGKLEFLGNTTNEYYGDFETANTETKYRLSVIELLKENHSILGKWYWPWDTSKISDNVFVFKCTPSFFNKYKGVLMCKTHVTGDNDNFKLPVVKYDERYNEKYYNEDGYYDPKFVEWITLRKMR